MFEMIFLGGIAFVVVIVVGLAAYRRARAKRDPAFAARIQLDGSIGLARAVVKLSQILAALVVVLVTAFGALLGAATGQVLGSLDMWPSNEFLLLLHIAIGKELYSTVGMILGALAAFLLSSLVMGLIFTLAAIERNTRHTALLFIRMSSRPDGP